MVATRTQTERARGMPGLRRGLAQGLAGLTVVCLGTSSRSRVGVEEAGRRRGSWQLHLGLVVASVGSPRLSSSWHDAAPRLLLLNPNGGDSSSLARRRLLLGTNGVLLFSGSDPGFLGPLSRHLDDGGGKEVELGQAPAWLGFQEGDLAYL